MESRDKILVLENSLKYLSRNLVFPKKEQDVGKEFYLKFAALSFSTIMFLVGSILHLAVNIKRKTYINLDLDLALAISLTGSYYFNFSYLKQIKNTIEIYKKLSDFQSFGAPDDFHVTNGKLNRIAKYHYVYIISAVCGLCIAPWLEYEKCTEENLELHIEEVCGLIGGMWLPVDLDQVPYKQLLYFFQVYSSGGTVEHLILRFKHVKRIFLDALRRNSRGQFKEAVQYHVTVTEMADMVNSSFNMCMFVHVLLTGAILGCVGYRLIKSYSLGAICLFIGWFVSMVMVCFSGQRLREESVSIGDAIYKSDWLTLNKDLERDLVLVLMRCQKPVFLRSGPFGYMSYATILTVGNAGICVSENVLKTSYSYLTLLSRTS
ncbi:hypothetical protein NQ315_011836 [Exocentrus adspersus]|uniref:Odorant receptor n=1 Tax=Exocentrus adspersus TaxID=1586481 RepID=A0AAV8W191_9CUCU|nr:hypothetical protein NQ315_011836 [Exocentrus adspersus]